MTLEKNVQSNILALESADSQTSPAPAEISNKANEDILGFRNATGDDSMLREGWNNEGVATPTMPSSSSDRSGKADKTASESHGANGDNTRMLQKGSTNKGVTTTPTNLMPSSKKDFLTPYGSAKKKGVTSVTKKPAAKVQPAQALSDKENFKGFTTPKIPSPSDRSGKADKNTSESHGANGDDRMLQKGSDSTNKGVTTPTNLMPSSKKDLLTPYGSAKKKGVASVTKKPAAKVQPAQALSDKNIFCCLPPPDADEDDFEAIAKDLSHPAMKVEGHFLDEFPFSTTKLPHVALDHSSYKRLTRDPFLYRNNPRSLYCNTALMNFYSQWTYRGENASVDYIPLRSEVFDLMNTRKSFEENTKLLHQWLEPHGPKLLTTACMDVTIFGHEHFSKAWIMNPSAAIQRTHFEGKSPTPQTPRAAILVANPERHIRHGRHDPFKIASRLRALMNYLDVHYNKSGGRAFNVNTVPLRVLGSTQQKNDWGCGYMCMIYSYLMRKHIKSNGPITTDMIDGGGIGALNLHHNPYDIHHVRSDLASIARALSNGDAPDSSNLRKDQNDSSKAQSTGSQNEKRNPKRNNPACKKGMSQPKRIKRRKQEEPNPGNTSDTEKKSTREKFEENRCKAMAKKSKRMRADVDHYTGMLSKGQEESEPETTPKKKKTRRLIDQHAASIAQVKDDTMRSSVLQLYNLNGRCNTLGSYGDEKLDEMHPKTKFITVCKDEVAQMPSRSGFGSRRAEPRLLCFGLDNHSDVINWLEYLVKNIDNIQTVGDKFELERELFGKRGRTVSAKRIEDMRSIIEKSKENNSEQFHNFKSNEERDSPKPQKATEEKEVSDSELDSDNEEEPPAKA